MQFSWIASVIFLFSTQILFRKYHITAGGSVMLLCIQMLAVKLNKIILSSDGYQKTVKQCNPVTATEISECSGYNVLQDQECLLQLQV
jgi:hypothetical protein